MSKHGSNYNEHTPEWEREFTEKWNNGHFYNALTRYESGEKVAAFIAAQRLEAAREVLQSLEAFVDARDDGMWSCRGAFDDAIRAIAEKYNIDL
jgi:hypothetical protein